MDTTGLLRILGRPAAEVHALFRCGSRVYGTATAKSDEDFVAVLARRDAKQDLLFRDDVNVVIHGFDSFRDALTGQNESWEDLERLYGPVRDDLLKELAALDSRKR